MGELTFDELGKRYGVNASDIFRVCNPNEFPCMDTSEIEPSKGLERIIGQEKHLEAIANGLETEKATYNILICGDPGTGKSLSAKILVDILAKTTKVENSDQIAWYNFDDSYEPHIMVVKAGTGKILRSDMKRFIIQFKRRLSKETDPEYIFKDYHRDDEAIAKYVRQMLKLGAEPASVSIPDIPFLPGAGKTHWGHKWRDEEAFEKLPEHEQEQLKKKVHNLTQKLMQELSEIEEDKGRYFHAAKKLNEKMIMEEMTDELIKKYRKFEGVSFFLNEIKADIIENIHLFYPDPRRGNFIGHTRDDEEFAEYKIKILVDNSETKGMPYKHVQNPTFSKLFGSVEWESLGLRGLPPHHRLKAGDLIKCNRGVIVIDEGKKIIYDPRSGFVKNEIRDFLLTALQEQEVRIGSGSGFYSDTGHGIESEPCEAKTKIILCANRDVESLINLPENEPLKRRFKTIITFDSDMANTLENRLKYFRFVADEIREFNRGLSPEKRIPAFSREAVARLVEHSGTYAGKEKLTLKLDEMADIVVRAGRVAHRKSLRIVQPEQVTEAIHLIRNEKNQYERKLYEAIEQGKILLGDNPEIGVVNGLAYVEKGTAFGIPLRIVATVTKGEKYLNIEKVAEKSGALFTKSFEEGISLLYQEYGSLENEIQAHIRLSVSQNYEGIEGPSAGAAEIDAILSEIGKIPVQQNIFITGAIDPKSGKVLGVGGINEKVKAAYYTCKKRNIKGGVIIPQVNLSDLQIVEPEIREDIEKQAFNIYQQQHYTNGLEILTGLDKSEINQKVKKNLELLARKQH